MNDMGVIAGDKREIRFYYNSESSIGKQALGYIKSSEKNVLEIDVSKTKVTATQWAELASGLNKSPSELIDTEHPDFINNYGNDVNLSDENEWLNLLENQPIVLKQPIIVNGEDFQQIDSPADVKKILGVDSASIHKK